MLNQCAAAHERISRHVPDADMMLICGPRVDPATVRAPEGVEVRGYLPRLYEHFAASRPRDRPGRRHHDAGADRAQAPIPLRPLEGHFEQEIAVAGRLTSHRAGERLRPSALTPDALADSALRLLGSEPDWPAIPIDGARNAAALIVGQLPAPTPAAR